MPKALRPLKMFVWTMCVVSTLVCTFAVLPSFAVTGSGLSFGSVLSTMAPVVPANPKERALPLLGYMDAFLDTTGSMTVEEIQGSAVQSSFQPYSALSMARESGALWLRFVLASAKDGSASPTRILDLGQGVPPNPILYIPQFSIKSQGTTWHSIKPQQDAVFVMPQVGDNSIMAFVRIDGTPSIWFAPTLRSADDAATSQERLAKPAVVVALAVVMLLCLLRGITEAGQWRIWASLYTAVALIAAYMGQPVTSKGYVSLEYMLPVLAPGLALILLPHVARHLMRTYQVSRSIDWQYRILTLVGMLVALLPLVPGFAWLNRYLELWPLATLLFVPTTIGAWLSALPGARRFLVGCLLPPLGVAVAFMGMYEPFFLPPAILGTLPMWGVALSALLIAATGAPTDFVKAHEAKGRATSEMEEIENLVDDDPNLCLVNVDEAQGTDDCVLRQENANRSAAQIEEHLRWPLDELLRHVSALESCALPMAAREHMGQLAQASREISHAISGPAMEHSVVQSLGGIKENIFDLQSLLRQAHDSVSAVADCKNIALSWFMPPQLGRVYKGDALQLLFVLRLLLESAVRATNRGAVQLAVRRVSESVNPGHLLFSVIDTGTGKPPQERSITALARAWELAASYHGFLGVESNAHGASISFTVHCEVTTQDMLYSDTPATDMAQKFHIILISDSADNRQLWAFFMENLPCAVMEARTGDEALSIYKEHPVQLLIFDARMPSSVLQNTLEALRDYEEKQNISRALCMAISVPKEDDDALHKMGFDYLLPLPTTRTDLRGTVKNILKDSVYTEQQHHTEAEENSVEESKAEGSVKVGMVSNMQEFMSMVQAQEFSNPLQQKTAKAESQEFRGIEYVEPDAEEQKFVAFGEDVAQEEPTQEEAVQEELAQEELTQEEADAEIVDTGMPILELHPEKSQVAQENSYGQGLDLRMDTPSPYAESASAEVDDVIEEQEPVQEPLLEPAYAEQNYVAPDSFDTNAYDAQYHAEQEDDDAAESSLSQGILFVDPNASPEDTAHLYAGYGDVYDAFDAEEEIEEEYEEVVEDAAIAVQTSAMERMFDAAMPDAAPLRVVEEALEDKEVKDTAQAPRQKLKLKPKAVKKAPKKLALRPKPSEDKSNAAYVSSFVEDLVEKPTVNSAAGTGADWVGEPMPLQKEAPASQELRSANSTEPSSALNLSDAGEQKVSTPRISLRLNKQADQVTPQAVQPMPTPEPIQSDAADWVGEPMPVQNTAAKPAMSIKNSQRPSLTIKPNVTKIAQEAEKNIPSVTPAAPVAPVTNDDWVGEPMPITKAEKPVAEVIKIPRPVTRTQDIPKEKPSLKARMLSKVRIGKSSKQKAEDEHKQNAQSVQPIRQNVNVVEKPEDMSSLSSLLIEDVSPPQNEAATFELIVPEATMEAVQEVGQNTQAQDMDDMEEESPISDLLRDLDTWMTEARAQFVQKNAQGVENAAGNIANNAEGFGLRTLGRLARTVESAARARDFEALGDLLPELETSVERNRIAMRQ